MFTEKKYYSFCTQNVKKKYKCIVGESKVDVHLKNYLFPSQNKIITASLICTVSNKVQNKWWSGTKFFISNEVTV